MSSNIINSRHPLYEANKADWNMQDLAFIGGRTWTDFAITQHTFEDPTATSNTGADSCYDQRQYYAANPVSIKPPIEKVQSSAQASSGQAALTVGTGGGADYFQAVLDKNANGEGLGWYSWLVGSPLTGLTLNSKVLIMVVLPPLPEGVEEVQLSDLLDGTIAPPKFAVLPASSVVQWTESEGDIRNGQFTDIMYKSAVWEADGDTGFFKQVPVFIRYTPTTITTYNQDGKPRSTEVNSAGFVPIVSAEIGGSLVGEGVQYSKQAVELDSLATQNMRDGYFNILVLTGSAMPVAEGEKRPTLSSSTAFNIPENAKLNFISPDSTPESETREKILALQNQLDTTVQQAHSNFAKTGASVGSGVAYKELGSYQAASVKFQMDILLEKFSVVVFYAQKMLGLDGEIVLKKPEDYSFEAEGDKIEQAIDLEALAASASSKESKKAINAKKLEKLFPDDAIRAELIKADNAAIDEEPEITNETLPVVDLDEE